MLCCRLYTLISHFYLKVFPSWTMKAIMKIENEFERHWEPFTKRKTWKEVWKIEMGRYKNLIKRDYWLVASFVENFIRRNFGTYTGWCFVKKFWWIKFSCITFSRVVIAMLSAVVVARKIWKIVALPLRLHRQFKISIRWHNALPIFRCSNLWETRCIAQRD